METEKCKIKLNSPENIYFAGQNLKGQITLILLKRTKIQGIKFRISGKGKTNWYDILRRESQTLNTPWDKPPQRSIVYSGRETYLLEELYIMGSINARPIELDVGEHTYDFSFNLAGNLPSSFIGTYGSIKYKIKFIVDKPWSFNDNYTLPITIVKTYLMPPLRHFQIQSPSHGFQQLTKNIGVLMFGGGPISLSAELPFSHSIRGEKLKLRVTVDNKSNTNIDRCKFSIRQMVTFTSQQPLRLKREQITKLFKKETGGIQKKTLRDFEHELQVPSCQPSDDDLSQIIHIKYEVLVEVVLPGLYKNLTISLPFTVYSTEIQDPINSDMSYYLSYPNPNVSISSVGSANPSSIGSPSRLSIYSDNSSLYSVTSGSGSTISDDSFRRNSIISSDSSSVRNSFRNSQYVVTENSQRFYPGVPDHLLLRNNNTNQSSANPSELPPSYEELFGNSSQTTAPPTSPVGK